ncbi:MAG: GNAT family N-acetyltransferase [Coriobacteriia bacterium]
MIEGERIYLAHLDKANIPLVLGWLADPEVNRFLLSGHEPIAIEDEVKWYEEMTASETDHVFQIHVADDARYIGNTGLHHIDPKHRHAELGIMIGSKPDQGQGYGRDAIVTLLKFAFDELALHRVYLGCDSANTRGLAAYRAVGFTEVGRERDVVFINGRFHDHVKFDMLEHEFRARHGA